LRCSLSAGCQSRHGSAFACRCTKQAITKAATANTQRKRRAIKAAAGAKFAAQKCSGRNLHRNRFSADQPSAQNLRVVLLLPEKTLPPCSSSQHLPTLAVLRWQSPRSITFFPAC
jgi:hypothetical protein